MGCLPCCGNDDEEDKDPGMVKNRKCRDILCLLIFAGYWAGMIVICVFAFDQGEPNRLTYGVDSYGFTCGTTNTYQNVSFDLTDSKNLYYLNPLELLDVTTLLYAKKVCSAGCPTVTCGRADFPCTNNSQYVCPYYRFAEDNLYGLVPNTTDEDTTYWGNLEYMTTLPNGTSATATSFLSKAKALGGPFAAAATSMETSLSGKYFQLQSQFPGNGPCYPVLFESTEYFYRCFPDFPANLTDALVTKVSDIATAASNSTLLKSFAKSWNSDSQQWGRYVGDISRGILIIVIGGLCGGLVLSLAWMVILRFMGGVMVWLMVITVNLMMIALCLYGWVKAGYIGDAQYGADVLNALPVEINPAESEQQTWFWIAVGLSIAAGITLLVTLLCITRLKIAIACIKVASQAVGAMPMLMFFPLLPFLFEIGLIIYWVAVTALLYSAGDLTANCRTISAAAPLPTFTFSDLANVSNIASSLPSYPSYNATVNATTCYTNVTTDERAYYCGQDPNCYLSYDWNTNLKYAFIYHFFGLLWTNQVIIGFSCVTIAGAIGQFYWAGGDNGKMPTFPILSALKNAAIFSLGSICFGAFIIAVIQFIRFMLEYLDRKTKEIQAANKFAAWAMCCVKCCMWCLEKIVKFINQNAYIMMAIKGTNYCCGAIKAVELIVTNALRMAVVNLVSDVLLFLGKVCVAGGAGLIAFAMTEADYYNNATKYPETFLYSPVLPVAISILTGFVVASIFFSVYEMAIDTILLAFCEDCARHDGNPKFAPPILMEAMDQVPVPAAKAEAK